MNKLKISNESNQYLYIYNMQQSNFFIHENIKVIGVGIGSKGDFYTKFEKSEASQQAFNKWNELAKVING